MKIEFDLIHLNRDTINNTNLVFRDLIDLGVVVEETFKELVDGFVCYHYVLVFPKRLESFVLMEVKGICFPVKKRSRSFLSNLFGGQ